MNKQSEKVKRFLNDIVELSVKYNLSLAHEDSHGAFIVEAKDDYNIHWLLEAQDKTK